MNPVATEDSILDTPPRSLWRALGDLAISVIVVAAVALITGFLAATPAHAQTIEVSDAAVVSQP